MARTPRWRFSIFAGNVLQGLMLSIGGILLVWSAMGDALGLRTAAMLAGYLLVYFSVHASAHWLVGRLVGIRFTHYTVGGSTHAAMYPPGLRRLFAHLPFFAVHVDRASLNAAAPQAQALMFGAGMTSSVVLSTAAAGWCALRGVPGGVILLAVNALWFVGALVAEARSNGDYAKAARALRRIT